MSDAPHRSESRFLRFRTRLLLGMMLVVLALTGLGLFLAQRKVSTEAELDLQKDFQTTLATLHGMQEVRHAALAERCRSLVRRPRIHAALEDEALDLLYLSARDELRDVMGGEDEAAVAPHALRARFYRFLDSNGAVISPPDGAAVGRLTLEEEAQLSLPRVPEAQQLGYLARKNAGALGAIDEVIAMPILSTETGEAIAALVLGFNPVELGGNRSGIQIKSGIQLGEHVHLPALSPSAQSTLAQEIERAKADADRFPATIAGEPHQVFHQQLNPGSLYPPAQEVVAYPLLAARARQGNLRRHVLIAGAALLLSGLAASHFIAARLSSPVEQLEVTSAEDRIRRAHAETVLEATSAELQRAARFSADASHQLKTPITVLRAGLEEVLAHDELPPGLHEEMAALVHQTFRLTSIVEDLLLLSRMDAGHLQISFSPINVLPLVEALMDDLSAIPDALNLGVETECAELQIVGEKRYVTLILQNLLENARKYNRPGGRIHIGCCEEGDHGALTIGNTGPGIPPSAREHIFERFHRGSMGENVPGHGLGLNLARELARLHGGDVRLTRSETDWTEFEVRFILAKSDGADAAVVPALQEQV